MALPQQTMLQNYRDRLKALNEEERLAGSAAAKDQTQAAANSAKSALGGAASAPAIGTQAPSAAVSQAQQYLQGAVSGKPAYQSDYTGQIADLYDQIMNRPKFSYDPNKDPLYQNYRDQYMRNGQLAMRDAMGTAAGLTGGYGNSWGDTAGFQAYQAYLQQLGAVIPQLEEQAYERYKDEGTDMLKRMALSQEMEDADFEKYQSALANWQSQQQQAENASGGTATGKASSGTVGAAVGAAAAGAKAAGNMGAVGASKITTPTIQNTQPQTASIKHNVTYSNMTDEQRARIIREIEASLK